jgi:hypothetical protein
MDDGSGEEEMPDSRKRRGFYLGLAIGQFWLAIIATVAASIVRVAARTPAETVGVLVVVVVVGLILIVADAFLLRLALRLPPDPAEGAAIGRAMGIRFGLIVLSAVVIIGAGNLLLAMTGRGEWTVPYTYFIVGLHFLPLAFVFGVRPYLTLGVLWVLVVIATVLTTSASSNAGQGLSPWIVLPIGGCGVVTWPVVGYVIARSLSALRTSSSGTPLGAPPDPG